MALYKRPAVAALLLKSTPIPGRYVEYLASLTGKWLKTGMDEYIVYWIGGLIAQLGSVISSGYKKEDS